MRVILALFYIGLGIAFCNALINAIKNFATVHPIVAVFTVLVLTVASFYFFRIAFITLIETDAHE